MPWSGPLTPQSRHSFQGRSRSCPPHLDHSGWRCVNIRGRVEVVRLHSSFKLNVRNIYLPLATSSHCHNCAHMVHTWSTHTPHPNASSLCPRCTLSRCIRRYLALSPQEASLLLSSTALPPIRKSRLATSLNCRRTFNEHTEP